MTAPNEPEHTAVAVGGDRTVVSASAGSRLEALAEQYAIVKPAADVAKAHLDEITDALKYELSQAAPGALKVDLDSPVLSAPLRLASRTAWRLDTTRLKAEQPETYVRYAKQTSYWELRAVANRGGGS